MRTCETKKVQEYGGITAVLCWCLPDRKAHQTVLKLLTVISMALLFPWRQMLILCWESRMQWFDTKSLRETFESSERMKSATEGDVDVAAAVQNDLENVPEQCFFWDSADELHEDPHDPGHTGMTKKGH